MLKSHLIIKGLKMKNALMLFFTLFFVSCSSTMQLENQSYDNKKIDTNSFKNFKEVMRINAKCKPCDNTSNDIINLNGVEYSSDIPLKCCQNLRKIDTNPALKKVYIHKINDLSQDQKIIKVQNKNTKFQDIYTIKRVDNMFYLLLKNELKERGIIVVETRQSPYVLKLDFDFLSLKSYYLQSSEYLSSKLKGFLTLKDINKTKKYSISTTQDVKKLKANNTDDFEIYFALLIKQAANKVAQEVSQF